MERLLKIPEVADRTALSRTTIYELIASGTMPTVSIGRSRRVREADLEDWIRERARAESPLTTTPSAGCERRGRAPAAAAR
jgi:excisionase family DNA binding protein